MKQEVEQGDRLQPLVCRFHNKNIFFQSFNSGPSHKQWPNIEQISYIWYEQLKPLNATIKITVAIQFKHKTLNQCCFNVGLAAGIVIQH